MYLMFVCVHFYVFIENKFNSETACLIRYSCFMPTVCLASSPGYLLGGGGGGGGVELAIWGRG